MIYQCLSQIVEEVDGMQLGMNMSAKQVTAVEMRRKKRRDILNYFDDLLETSASDNLLKSHVIESSSEAPSVSKKRKLDRGYTIGDTDLLMSVHASALRGKQILSETFIVCPDGKTESGLQMEERGQSSIPSIAQRQPVIHAESATLVVNRNKNVLRTPMEEEMSALKARLALEEGKVDEANTKADEFERKCKETEILLEEYNRDNGLLKENLAMAMDEIDELRINIAKAAENQINEADKSREEYSAEMRALKKKLVDYTNEIYTQRRKYEDELKKRDRIEADLRTLVGTLQNILCETKKDASDAKKRAEEFRHKNKETEKKYGKELAELRKAVTKTLLRMEESNDRRKKSLGEVKKDKAAINDDLEGMETQSEESLSTSHLTNRGKATHIDSAGVDQIPMHGSET
eukprot:15355510-Ditylum_brightwellii.AAC.1